jgi:hypothetical protein
MTVRALRDIGELLAWASRPTQTPGRDDDYDRVVRRYLDEPEFADAADAVLIGAGLRLTVDERDGAIVIADATSPLRYTTADIIKRSTIQQRAVVGVILLAVARVAYPDSGLLDDPDRRPVFTTQNVVDALDRAAQVHADDAATDADLDGATIELWRRWLEIAEARPNAERLSAKDRAGVVAKVCRFLVETGHLQEVATTDRGTWKARSRFRHAVMAIGEDTDLFRMVNGLVASGEESPRAAETPGSALIEDDDE